MGGSASTLVKEEGESDKLIGEGSHGKVYTRKGGVVVKKGKQKTLMPDSTTDFGRELRAYTWIDSLSDDPKIATPYTIKMQSAFARALTYQIYRDNTFTHISSINADKLYLLSTNPDAFTEDEKIYLRRYEKEAAEKNAWPYTYELSIEDKGHPIDYSLVTPKTMTKAIIQLLRVIRFMQDQDVVHIDLHLGNIVIQPNGDIALIDYGEMYVTGEHVFYTAAKEHTMLTQVVGMMTDIENTFRIEAQQPVKNLTSPQKRIQAALALPDVRAKLLSVSASIEYPHPISRVLTEETAASFAYSLLLDMTKAKHPEKFKELMGFAPSAELHTWFKWEDIEVIYDNLKDIPAIIRYFEAVKT
jgi:hypothetical protein